MPGDPVALEQVDGVGPKGARALRDGGITTVELLAEAPHRRVAELLPRRRIDLIRADARRRLGRAS